MQLEQLVDSLPNGFHDAKLENINLDYVSRRATLQMQLLIGVPDGETQEERETYKPAEVHLSEVLYFVIEAPDSNYKYPTSKELDIDAGRADEKSAPTPPIPLDQLPAGISAYWFFVSDWNSFIHVAAMGARLHWL